MTDSDTMAALEERIDKDGLGKVIEMLADICSDKAEHLRANWQDEATGAMWDKAARLLTRTQSKLPV